MKPEQMAMDFGCGELPLFSGTPQAADEGPGAQPQAGAGQATWATCRVCLDTGRIEAARGVVRYCSCAAGQAALLADREKGADDGE